MDFIGKRKITYLVSGILVLISITAFFALGLNLGVDFTGGTLWEVEFKGSQPSPGELREFLSNPEPYKRGIVQKANKLMQRVRTIEEKHLAEEKETAKQEAEALVHAVTQMPEFQKIKSDEGKGIVDSFRNNLYEKVDRATSFSNVRDSIHTYGIRKRDEARAKVLEETNPKVQYATVSEKKFGFKKQDLSTAEDVKEYGASLVEHYLKLIAQDKRIGV